MRIKHAIVIKISDDAAGKDVLFETDSTLAESTIDSYAHSVSGRLTIPLNTTLAMSFDSLTAVRGIYLKVNQNCSVSINGGTAIVMALADALTTTRAKLFFEGVITSVSVISPVLLPVEVSYCFYGDVVV